MFEYVMDKDKYVLVDTENGRRIADYDRVDVGYSVMDSEDGYCTCMHKHGSPDQIMEWYQRTRKKYIDAGHRALADDLRILMGPIPVDELNKIINNTGYLDRIVRKNVTSNPVSFPEQY